MSTVSELIHSSFRLIGAIAAGETLETNELNDAFVSLNQMISSWNTEGLTLYGRRLVQIALTQSNNYAMTPRAVKIDAASVAISGIDCPLEIVDAAGWEAITEKLATAIQIKKLYCDYEYPNARLYIWPTPRITGGLLEMFIYEPLLIFQTVNDTIDLPSGYEMALRYNFAIALLPEYPRSQVDPTLPAQAQNYKASLVQLNASNHTRTAQPTATTLMAQGTS
jgi:hypothetical protein